MCVQKQKYRFRAGNPKSNLWAPALKRRGPRLGSVMTSDSHMRSDNLSDDDYPAYTMGRAAEMLGTTPTFLRSLGEAKLIQAQRSEGGHRRYSRYQLRLAARVRELVDQGTALEAACRIIILEDQLAEAQRLNEKLREQK